MVRERLQEELLDQASATEALATLQKLAAAQGVEWALVGGLAAILYGSARMTKDIDAIAQKPLAELPEVGPLQQGGVRYAVATERESVFVDWITRSDGAAKFYQRALAEATTMDGLPIVTPEWLVILKFIAGRFKDQEDAVALLSRPGLVDRRRIKEIVREITGAEGWAMTRHGFKRWYNLADGQAAQAKEGYIDS